MRWNRPLSHLGEGGKGEVPITSHTELFLLNHVLRRIFLTNHVSRKKE